MKKVIDQDLIDFWQGITEVEIFTDLVNYYFVQLEEYSKDEHLMKVMGRSGEYFVKEVEPKVRFFNKKVKSFTSKCTVFQKRYLEEPQNSEKRNDLMLKFSEGVDEIRELANILFEDNQLHIISLTDHFQRVYPTLETFNPEVNRRIQERQQPYKYSKTKNYLSEEEAMATILPEKLKQHLMARLEFMGHSWYPKYVFYL